MPSSQVPKLGQNLHIIEKFWIRFSVKKNFSKHKGYVRSYHNGSIRNWRRQEIFVKRMNYTIKSSSHVLPWLSCHDLAVIMVSVPWLRTLGWHIFLVKQIKTDLTKNWII